MNWKNLESGDTQSWRNIFLEHIDFLHDYGAKILDDEESVKDAIQDVFLSIYERRNNISQIENIRAYLCRAVRYKLLDKRRLSIQYKTEGTSSSDFELSVDFKSTMEENEYNETQAKQLDAMLHKLTSRQREFIFLKYYNGFSNEEIADITGINKQSVANMLHESLRKMRDSITMLLFFIVNLYYK